MPKANEWEFEKVIRGLDPDSDPESEQLNALFREEDDEEGQEDGIDYEGMTWPVQSVFTPERDPEYNPNTDYD